MLTFMRLLTPVLSHLNGLNLLYLDIRAVVEAKGICEKEKEEQCRGIQSNDKAEAKVKVKVFLLLLLNGTFVWLFIAFSLFCFVCTEASLSETN